MKKKAIIFFAILLALLFLWRVERLIFGTLNQSGRKDNQTPIAVEVDSVQFELIREIRLFTGSVYPAYQYVLAPKVAGRLLKINKRIGDWVCPGEIVALLDDAEYQQSVREAEANLKIAQASLVEANSQFYLAMQEQERVRQLQQKGIASSSELDAANTNYAAQKSRLELSQAQVEQREAALKSAQIRLDYTILKANQAGFIGERYVDEGTLLTINTPVVLVVGIDKVIVRTNIIERDYGRIQVGQSAEVYVDAYEGRSFSGRVERIAPILDEAARVAKMEVEVENSDHLLKPGMFAKVAVTLSQNPKAQTVPSRAIIHKDGQNGVFVVDRVKKTAKYVPVQLGIIGEVKTEIQSPILDGPVVTLGQHLLNDGSPVIIAQKTVFGFK